MIKTFKELLDESNVNEVIDYIITEQSTETKEAYEKVFEELKSLTPASSDRVFIGFTGRVNEDDKVDAFLLEEVKEKVSKNENLSKLTLETIDEISGNEAVEHLKEIKLPKTLGFEYEPWEEILSYKVNEENVKEFGLTKFVGFVVSKITYFGMTNEEVSNVREIFNTGLALQETKDLAKLKIKPGEPGAHHLLCGFGTQDKGVSQEIEKIESTKRALKNKVVEYKTFSQITENF